HRRGFAGGRIDAVDAMRAGVVDRSEERLAIGSPQQVTDGAVPPLGDNAALSGGAIVQRQASTVVPRARKGPAAVGDVFSVRRIRGAGVAGGIVGGGS